MSYGALNATSTSSTGQHGSFPFWPLNISRECSGNRHHTYEHLCSHICKAANLQMLQAPSTLQAFSIAAEFLLKCEIWFLNYFYINFRLHPNDKIKLGYPGDCSCNIEVFNWQSCRFSWNQTLFSDIIIHLHFLTIAIQCIQFNIHSVIICLSSSFHHS